MRISTLLILLMALLVTLDPAYAGPVQVKSLDQQPKVNKFRESWENSERQLLKKQAKVRKFGLGIWQAVLSPAPRQLDRATPALEAPPDAPISLETYNGGFGRDPGEPNPQGKMSRTFWRIFSVAEPSRVVLHTYGSEIDTALAVYTGNTYADFKKIAFNDNTAVPGGSAQSSLVAIDAVPGEIYNVQVGAATGAEGDARLDAFVLPEAGGITALLVDGNPAGTFPGADWVCRLGAGALSSCPSPVFLLHNATTSSVTVTASSTFGTGSVPPAPFVLAPGATVLKSFTFNSGFDTTALRSVSGIFQFKAKSGTKLVGVSRTAGLVTVFGFDTTGVSLKLRSVPLVQSEISGRMQAFPVEIANEGTATAVGCQFSQFLPDMNIIWYRYNSVSKSLDPDLNPVFDIGAGKKLQFVLGMTSASARLADTSGINAECTNAPRFVQQTPDAYKFDMTVLQPLNTRLAPFPQLKGDVLKVPASGLVHTLEVYNEGDAGPLTVVPTLLAPGSDPQNQRYKAYACTSTQTNSECLNSNASSITFNAPARKKFTVKIAVIRPPSDPGFDPELRRLVVTLKETVDFFGPVTAGQHSIALQYR